VNDVQYTISDHPPEILMMNPTVYFP
jgi:hypothetical protein